MHYKELVFSRRPLLRSCCGYKPKTIWMILILPAYLRPTKSREEARGFIHISTHEKPAEFLLCYRCAMIYHCVVNLQIMEDQMTPARSFVLNVIFLKPKALKPKEVAVFKSKKDFVCQARLFPKCATCNSEMSKKTKQNKRKSDAWMNSRQQRTWTCFECETRANFHKK